MNVVKRVIHKKWIDWVVVSLLLAASTVVHMGPSFTQCRSVVLGHAGDHTAGIMYNSWIVKRNPLAGFSDKTNFPYGENLRQPTSLTSIIPSTMHLVFSKATNLACGWNILVFISYMSGGLAMYGLVKWVTKKRLVALFAAYAVTFTPYHAFASRGQIAGLLNVMFILSVWWFLYMQQKPTKKKGIVLGCLVGINFYIDGYFILFGGVLLGAFWLVLLIQWRLRRSKKQNQEFRQKVISLLTGTLVALFILSPLLWVNFAYRDKINSFLGGTRSPVKIDAQNYSAKPQDYFLPPKTSPFGGQFSEDISRGIFKDNGNPGLMFVGLGIAGFAALCVAQLFGKRKENLKKISTNAEFSTLTLVTLSCLAFVVSLKPYFVVAGIKLYTPSALIIQITPAWRVFGRLYMLVAIGFVSLASVGLARMINSRTKVKYGAVILVALVTFFELRSFPALDFGAKFDYRSAPEVYYWLKTRSDIDAIAEYPLNDPPQGRFLSEYYTFQTISGKPLLNSALPNSEQSALRRSIAGLNDPQTLPVLRGLGIDLVNVHPSDNESNNDNNVYNEDLETIFTYKGEYSTIDSLRIKPGKVAEYALVLSKLQYFQVKTTSDQTARYSLGNPTLLSIEKLPDAKGDKKTVTISFDVTAIGRPRNIAVVQNGKLLWSGQVDKTMKNIVAAAAVDRPIAIQIEDTPEELDRLLVELRNPQIID